MRTADYSLMREMNVALILERLHRSAPLSRARLAEITGLNKTTVSSLVKELIDARFVRENGWQGDKGRPAIMLELNPDAGCIIGAEIGVDFINVIVTRFDAEPIWRRKESTAGLQDQEAIQARILEIIREACSRVEAAGSHVLGLGLGVPGLVDISTGTLLFAPNLGWQDAGLRAWLEAEFSFPVYVDNEANMAALGECYFGAARHIDLVLYVSAGVGLGGGIVLNQRLLQGATGFAGEVGHMTMNPGGPRCNCGNFGCWETYASQWAVFRRVREALERGQGSRLAAAAADPAGLTIPLIVEAAQAGDQLARAALEETGLYLGIGLANLINALNPRRVVFGGILSRAHEFLLPVIQRVVGERALRWSRQATEIVIATHGEDECVMGGVATVYHHILSQPRAAAARG